MLSTMKRSSMIIILLFILLFLVPTQFLVVKSAQRKFDFFYFVQHWPGSECNTKKGCCYPTTGKPVPADFGIHGLWPEYNDGTYPTNCNPKNPYDSSKIKDLIPALQKNWPSLACPSEDGSKIWTHEWEKHGTCSLTSLNQHGYFNAALKLKAKINLLQVLAAKGVKPDGRFYALGLIMESISNRTGFTPGIQCNKDKSNNLQFYQATVCVNKSSNFIYCPAEPGTKSCHIKGNKGKQEIKFPSFTMMSWEHEWDETISAKSFNAALQLKAGNNLRQILVNAGIRPVDGSSYSSEQVVNALTGTIGVAPRIECNAKSQLYQVYLCVDKSADLNFIECPRENQMTINCRTPKAIEFPSFPVICS